MHDISCLFFKCENGVSGERDAFGRITESSVSERREVKRASDFLIIFEKQ